MHGASGSSLCIIGGSGFIGSRLTHRLSAQDAASLRIIDIAAPQPADHAIDYRKVDVRNADLLVQALEGCSIMVNLAAVHRDDVRPLCLYQEVNVDGAKNTCRAAEINGIETVVFTSSVAVYGMARENAAEVEPHRPFNEYGRTKSAAEEVYVRWYEQNPGTRRLVIIRPTVVFGPGNRGNVYNLLSQIASGRFLMVGDGHNRKSMAYVDNVVGFIVHVMNGPPGLYVYNYVDKPDFSMNELIAVVRRSLGKDPTIRLRLPCWMGLGLGVACDVVARTAGISLPVSKVRVEKFCADTVFSADRALRQAGFLPPVPLDAALHQTIAAEFS